MAIEVAGRKYRTLNDDIFVNDKKVYRADVNGQKVYPEDAVYGKYILVYAYYGSSHYHQHAHENVRIHDWEGGLYIDYKTVKGERDYQWRIKYAATFKVADDAPENIRLSYEEYVPPSIYDNMFKGDRDGVSVSEDLHAGTVGSDLSLPVSAELFAVRITSSSNAVRYYYDSICLSEFKESVNHPPVVPCASQVTTQIYTPTGNVARTFVLSETISPSVATNTFLLGRIREEEHKGSNYRPGRVGAVATSARGIAIVDDYIRYYSTIRHTESTGATDNINPSSHSFRSVTSYAPIDQIIYCGDDSKLASVDRIKFTEGGYELLY